MCCSVACAGRPSVPRARARASSSSSASVLVARLDDHGVVGTRLGQRRAAAAGGVLVCGRARGGAGRRQGSTHGARSRCPARSCTHTRCASASLTVRAGPVHLNGIHGELRAGGLDGQIAKRHHSTAGAHKAGVQGAAAGVARERVRGGERSRLHLCLHSHKSHSRRDSGTAASLILLTSRLRRQSQHLSGRRWGRPSRWRCGWGPGRCRRPRAARTCC